MATVATRPMTAEEFRLMPEPRDGSKAEMLRGEIVMTPPPGFRHGLIQLRIAGILDSFVTAKNLGRTTVESGLRTETSPDTVRGPDVAFWSYERLPADQNPAGYPTVAVDLVVEVLSPSDSQGRVMEKVREYLAHGVRAVWLADPEERTITTYRTPDEGHILREQATLTEDVVLPGFSCRIADLF